MRLIKYLFFVLLFSIIPFVSFSQIDFGSASSVANGGAVTAKVKDWMAIDVNPSNLGWEDNRKASIILGNFGLNFQSPQLDYHTMAHAIINPNDSFNTAAKQRWQNIFSSSPGFFIDYEFNWASASAFFPKVGGFAASLTDRIIGRFNLNPAGADLMFNGVNSSTYINNAGTTNTVGQILNGSSFGYTHFREFNLDFGRKVWYIDSNSSHGKFNFYGGLGLKYILGLANATMQDKNGILNSEASEYSEGFNKDLKGWFNAPGHGFGFDLGTSATYKKWRFALAATDIGFIRWGNNLRTSVDSNLPKLASTNVGTSSWSYLNFPLDDVIKYQSGTTYSTGLPAKLRAGASFRPDTLFEFTSDVVFPLNRLAGNIPGPYAVITAEIFGILNANFNLGFAYSSYGLNVPFGIFIRGMNMYIGTADILSLFDLHQNSNLSIVTGIFCYDF